MKADPCQGRGAELHRYVRIYILLWMTLFVTAHNLLVPRPKILAPSPTWNFRGPVCFASDFDFAYKPPILPSVSETQRFQGSKESNQGAINERP